MQLTDKTKIEGKRFGEERALYGSRGLWVLNCAFDGEEDGESALKESSDITVQNTLCNLRYPFWHDRGLAVLACELTEKCRAALWYSEKISIHDSKLLGVKALRECRDVHIDGCEIVSAEFGWSSEQVFMEHTSAEGEYFMLRGKDLRFSDVTFRGKYSYQYVENVTMENCTLDTKDAFWHARNVTLKNCTVKGEYLAWYSENLTMIDCRISGTQPFCYCKGLKLVNCSMEGADLAFEKSEVDATITTPVISIKNATSGRIVLPSVGELICTDPDAGCEIVLTESIT
ncbi:MAG: DUF3737 family protein [Clostridia bacterium]|nr:DUF3737 family protein [Clostridia bacterium]